MAFCLRLSSCATIISRTKGILSLSNNICSVRHRPIPHAPNFIATDASQIFTQDKRHENIMKLTIISDNAKNRLVNDIGINTGHLATFISHTNAMHTILNRELKFGCIFEDDVTLKPNFLKEFSMLYKELPKDWDIFLLNQFCHQSGCEINNALKPISKHLMPVKMFYSGAGYCLNANSARKILSTLPCEHKSYCTIAIDAYMGFLVKEGFLKALLKIFLFIL